MEDALRERFAMDWHGMQKGGHYFVLFEHLAVCQGSSKRKEYLVGNRYVDTSKETTVVFSALL